MIGAINLWDPGHVTFTVDLVTAFLLGLVHGITPDEHTWPITFSYAVGSHSTARGLRAGLIFSLAFTAQQALASELSNRMLENVNENVGSALDVAQKLASSRSVQDMVKIQTEFAQTHGKRIVEQTNENLSLAMKAGSDAFSSWSSAFTGRAST